MAYLGALAVTTSNSALQAEKTKILAQISGLQAKTTKTSADQKAIFDLAARARAIDAQMAANSAKNQAPSANNAAKSYSNPVGSGTLSVSQAAARAINPITGARGKEDESDSGFDWEAISGIVGSVAATTKGILDQQEARKQQREAARIQAASPPSSGGGSGLPIAGADLPWGKIVIGAGVGIVGILILKKLLS